MILRTWSKDAFAAAVAEGLALWANVSEHGRRQIGPIKRSVDDVSLDRFLAKSLTERQKFARQSPSGVEYQHDGTKTAVIIAAALYDVLINLPWSEYKESEAEAIRQNLFEARNVVLNYFGQPDVARPFSELVDLALWPPADTDELEAWLLRQPLTISGDSPAQMTKFYPITDIQFPFIVFKRPQDNYSLESLDVYWLDRGMNVTYFDNIIRHPTRWDKTRLQLTLKTPYLLLCNGILRGNEWSQAITDKIRDERDPRSAKPVLIILADGVDEDIQFPSEDFYSLVLPAPRDATLDPQGSDLPRRPQLEMMARAFGAGVAHLWVDPIAREEPDWTLLAEKLGRCEMAQIDRQRTVLVPPDQAAVTGEAPAEDWYARSIHALILPADSEESTGQAEAMMRWRIEAEEGVVAGAGAALYWAAQLLAEAKNEPAGWLQQALQASLRQILENAGVDPDDAATGHQVTEEVDSADGPWRSFFVDRDRVWVDDILTNPEIKARFRVIDTDPPTILGQAVELGLVTPLSQIQRIVAYAPLIAWQLALLHLGQTMGEKGESK